MDKIVAGDPETRSAYIVAENLEHLKALFPEAFTEGKIDFEVLKQLLGNTVAEGGSTASTGTASAKPGGSPLLPRRVLCARAQRTASNGTPHEIL